jgi:hypothetical protein
MHLCFWSTTFQADSFALAGHLLRAPNVSLTIVAPQPSAVQRMLSQSFGRACEIIDRGDARAMRDLAKRRFDVMVVDNHLPRFMPADRLFVMWHGVGWRFDDLRSMRRELARLVGDVTRSNPRFAWQAIGEWDRGYRVAHSGLHPDNVHALGSPYSDLLLPKSSFAGGFDRAAQQPFYSVDLTRKIVLLAMTWHHEWIVGQWGNEEALLRKLIEHVSGLGAALILRMHDRRRYRGHVVRLVEQLVARYPRVVMLKWKDESPDSLSDLLVSDVCVSNYSSILNWFYFTERPSLHVEPQGDAQRRPSTFRMFMGLPIRRRLESREQLWKLSPEEHGGLRARSFEELLSGLSRALAEPRCCEAASRAFVARFVAGADGNSAERTWRFLRDWVSGTAERAERAPALQA